MEITILADNEKENDQFLTEHGLSILVEHEDNTILFDTGFSDIFIENARRLGKDLTKVNFVVLSHGHYDHTGGLKHFLKINQDAKILLKRAAINEKWSISENFNREIGFPLKDKIKSFAHRIEFINDITEIAKGVFIIPDIAKLPNHSYTDHNLFIMKNGVQLPDNFEDELFMTINKRQKLIIFTGCAHNGVENMVNTAIAATSIGEVECIVGGTHLNRSTPEQLSHTIDMLNFFKINHAYFNHCTGIQNIEPLNKELPCEVKYAYVGNKISI